MLDTLRLVLPGFVMPNGFDEERWVLRTASNGSAYSEIMTAKNGPFFLQYSQSRRELVVEASIASLAFGTNVEMPRAQEMTSAIEVADRHIQDTLVDCWGAPLTRVPSIGSWSVRRADLFFNYRPTVVPFDAARTVLMSLQPARGLVAHRIDRTTAYFHTKHERRRAARVEIAIYDKGAEMALKKPARSAAAANLLRIEVRLRGLQTIRSAFGRQVVTLSSITDAATIVRVIESKLRYVDLRPDSMSVSVGREMLAQKVGRKEAFKLWAYMLDRATMCRHDVAQLRGISDETARRYERRLRELGLFPAAVSSAGVIEELMQQLRARAEQQGLDARDAVAGEPFRDHVVADQGAAVYRDHVVAGHEVAERDHVVANEEAAEERASRRRATNS
jgi:hypothetical protein